MSFESRYWKEYINKDVKYIEDTIKELNNKKNYKNGSLDIEDESLDEKISLLEIKIFTIAFAMRKLALHQKVSDALNKKRLKIHAYKRNTKQISCLWESEFNKYYDWSSGYEISKSIEYINNQLIHSEVMNVFFDPSWSFEEFSKMEEPSLFVVSDYNKDKCIYTLSLQDYLSVAKLFANDFPTKITLAVRNKKLIKRAC